MMTEVGQPRPKSFYILGFFFLLFLAFLYGPMIVIFILSFQGPNGGMSFPMVGHSTLWFQQLLSGTGRIGDIPSAFIRSLETASLAAILTVAICVSAGMAFRRRFPGSALLFYTAVSSLVMPSLFVGFGIALGFKELGWKTGLFTSGLGAQLTWTLPFGLMITFATIGRFDRRYEEAATDLGANGWQRFRDIVLPIILPGVIGVGAVRLHAVLRRVRPFRADRRNGEYLAARDLGDDDGGHIPGPVRPRHGNDRRVLLRACYGLGHDRNHRAATRRRRPPGSQRWEQGAHERTTPQSSGGGRRSLRPPRPIRLRRRTHRREQELRRSGGGRGDLAADSEGKLLLPARPERLWQVDDSQDDRRSRTGQFRRHPDRRPQRHRRAAERARNVDDVPELRALSPYDGRRQRRLQS